MPTQSTSTLYSISFVGSDVYKNEKEKNQKNAFWSLKLKSRIQPASYPGTSVLFGVSFP